MKTRIGVCALVLAAFLATVCLFVAGRSDGLESIIYEDLTCEELQYSYNFNYEVMLDMIYYYINCTNYVDEKLDGHPHGALECRFAREHGLFVEQIKDDLAAVYQIKCALE